MSHNELLQKMSLMLKRTLQWMAQHILITIFGFAVLVTLGLQPIDTGRIENVWKFLIELMLLPTPLWATIGLLVATYPLLKTTIYRSSVTPKKEKPNLSKKTEMQEQILNAFKTETNLDQIAKILNIEPTLVRRNVDILSKDLLIAWSSSGSPSWYLTEHGRAYLYPTP